MLEFMCIYNSMNGGGGCWSRLNHGTRVLNRGISRIARDGRGSRSKPDAQGEVKVKHSMRWLLSQPLRWDENVFAVGRSKASSLKRHIQMKELGQSAPSRVKAVLEQIHIHHVYNVKNF